MASLHHRNRIPQVICFVFMLMCLEAFIDIKNTMLRPVFRRMSTTRCLLRIGNDEGVACEDTDISTEDNFEVLKNEIEEAKEKDIHQEESRNTFVSYSLGGHCCINGGVSSICKAWNTAEAKGLNVTGIYFKEANWMCRPERVGNKLGFYFQARAFAHLNGVSFHIKPGLCRRDKDNLIAWLPQTVIPTGKEVNFTKSSMSKEGFISSRKSMCECGAGGPLANQCRVGWPQLAQTWQKEIRTALQSWALSAKKPVIEKGTVTIHLRCGDILKNNLETKTAKKYGFFKSSFYVKHLKDYHVERIHILTTSLDSCKGGPITHNSRDCLFASQCSMIIDALIQKLSESLNLSKDRFQVYDKKSALWSMHHIAFSDVSFCTPSTFCTFPSFGSKYSVHSIASRLNFPSIQHTLPLLLETFEVDYEGDYFLPMNNVGVTERSKNITRIIEFIKH